MVEPEGIEPGVCWRCGSWDLDEYEGDELLGCERFIECRACGLVMSEAAPAPALVAGGRT